MEYKGKLYGKVGEIVFPLLHTTDDWEKMEARIAELEALTKPTGINMPIMQGLPDSEIYRWLKSKNYQYSYDETQEYRMLFELDFSKIIREFVAEHLGSPTVGKSGGDASVSDGK